jgi:glycosyltransferase involved in cell wall biosynthesis
MKQRIGLFLGSDPSVGGTFQYNMAMLEAVSMLPSDRYDVVVLYTYAPWADYLKGYSLKSYRVLSQQGVLGRVLGKLLRRAGLPISLYRQISCYFHPVAKALVKHHCNLWVFPSQDDWTYLSNVPALGVIHDLMHRYERNFPEVLENGEYKRRETRYSAMCRWAKGILVDSTIGKQHVVESYQVSPEQVHILPFIGPKYIHQLQSSAEFDQTYRLPQKYIFYPAQFWEHKNHKGLVNAIALLKDEIPDLQLVFSGSKKNGYASTLALAQELGVADAVHCLGYVPDVAMPELFRRARAMVMPSFFGPTNIPPLEAIALGCPVAVSNVYGMPEQMGEAALTFDPYSPEAIAQVIKQLWLDDALCNDLSKKGLVRANAWTQQHFSDRLQQIIQATLKA